VGGLLAGGGGKSAAGTLYHAAGAAGIRPAWWGPKIAALERHAHLKGRIVTKYRLPGLVLLVAVPLPGTGAWTGALVASLLDIRMKTALPAIAGGVLIAGALTSLITGGVAQLFF